MKRPPGNPSNRELANRQFERDHFDDPQIAKETALESLRNRRRIKAEEDNPAETCRHGKLSERARKALQTFQNKPER